ncbi:Uncharacterized protein HZ326_27796, partial [Fusarium oxysporum f. sp. albedinis]
MFPPVTGSTTCIAPLEAAGIFVTDKRTCKMAAIPMRLILSSHIHNFARLRNMRHSEQKGREEQKNSAFRSLGTAFAEILSMTGLEDIFNYNKEQVFFSFFFNWLRHGSMPVGIQLFLFTHVLVVRYTLLVILFSHHSTMVLNSSRPQRRYHTKSRGGCVECKKRHLKVSSSFPSFVISTATPILFSGACTNAMRLQCGEEKPACRSCVIRYNDCVYPTQRNSSLGTRASSLHGRERKASSRGEQQESPSPPSDDSCVALTPDLAQHRHVTAEFELQDLALTHHWTLHTSRTISHCWSVESRCSVDAFSLGFDHLFVMYGILSIASLHLASLEPFDKKTHLERAAMHHKLGVDQVRQLTVERMEASGDALRAFSTINLVYTLA